MLTAWSPTWVTAPGDHIVDLRGVDSCPGHQFLEAVRQQVDGQHVVQRAAGLALSDRGANRSDDDRVPACISSHFCLLRLDAE